MQHREDSTEREVQCIIGLPQEARKITNKNTNPIPKRTRKTTNKAKSK